METRPGEQRGTSYPLFRGSKEEEKGEASRLVALVGQFPPPGREPSQALYAGRMEKNEKRLLIELNVNRQPSSTPLRHWREYANFPAGF